MKKFGILLFLFIVSAFSAVYGLTAGDIAIIGVNTDATKNFVFVALVDIPANTTITFTDNAWTTANGPFATTEGYIQWSNTSATSAGTVVTLTVNTSPYAASLGSVTTNTNFNLSASGDQIYAFEGDWSARPTTGSASNFLYAISIENFITTGTTTSNTSYLASALNSASVAMTTSSTEFDNAYFANGSTAQTAVSVSGTKSELLALFNDASKYYKNDTGPLTQPTYTITVSSGTTAPTTQASGITFANVAQTQMDVSWTNGDGAKRIVIMNSSNSFTNPTDGTDPTADNSWNNAGEQVVYNGSGSTVPTVSGLSAGTTYWFRVYEYNGTGTGTLYLTSTATNNPNSQITASSVVVPTVTTASITAITASSASGGGNVTADGGGTVTARGVCWNTTGTPSIISDSYTTDGSGLGSFTSTISPLSASQLYYVRAYATNSAGTAYGDEVQFTTLKAEPTYHVSSFAAVLGTPAYSSIVLTWTDAAKVTPDGYLIKGSDVGYSSIVDPTDGVTEAWSTLVHTVNQGTQTYTFNGLSGNTTYYFKIYPYTNSGTNIDYKIDGTVPQAQETTETAPTLIHYWNFNTGAPASPANWTQPVAATQGTGSLSYTFANATSFGGTTVNGIESEVAGGCFVPQGGTGNVNNGEYFEMSLPTTGYQDIVLSYPTQRTTTGFTSQAVYYSVNGTSFTLFETITSIPASWGVKTLDFSSVVGANNNPNFKVRIILDGATASAGNNRFDNIRLMGYPYLLPVELSSFTAIVTAQNYVALHWTTQSETNVAGYYIYRNNSSDLTSATRINALITAANTSTETNYVFTDEEVHSGNTYYYWLQNLDFGGSFDFHGPISIILPINGNDVPPLIPTVTELLDAYPNPFNPETRIRYTVKNAGDVRIDIYNNRGQLIRSFSQNHAKAGFFQIAWDGRDMNGRAVSSGIYYYRMTSGKYTSSKKVVLMK